MGDVNVVIGQRTVSVALSTTEINTSIGASSGIDGADGREIELQKSATHVQWRYVGDVSWTNLVPLADLKGDAGDRGLTPRGAFDSLTQYYVDDLVTHAGSAYICTVNSLGNLPTDINFWLKYIAAGEEIELQKSLTHIQWRYVGDVSWTNLVALADLKGDKGDKGDTGSAATIAVGTVTTVAPNASATVTNSGTSGAAIFDFEIPQGEKGDKGDAGISPTIAAGTNISVVESPAGTFTINNTQDISGKLDANTPITGATKTKITYDADGLVTGGADATTADIADSTDKRYVTDAQLTVIGNTSGTNSGDQNLFSTIAVSGQNNVVADSTSDTLTLVAGTNITITTDQSTDSITITSNVPVDSSYKKSFMLMGA